MALLLEHTPRFSIAAATSLAEELYGIPATATPLPSERDQNFLLETQTSETFVLKIANALEVAAARRIELHDQIECRAAIEDAANRRARAWSSASSVT